VCVVVKLLLKVFGKISVSVFNFPPEAGWGGHHCNIKVWSMVPPCLMWRIWRGHNTQNFEDCERTVIGLKAIMFKSLYVWMIAYNSSRFSNFLEFLDLCSFFSS